MPINIPSPPVITNDPYLSKWLFQLWLAVGEDRKIKTTVDADLYTLINNHSINKLKMYQTVTPAPDGAQLVFTTSGSYRTGTLWVMRDQSYLSPTVDFTETTADTFTMVVAPDSDELIYTFYVEV